MASVTYNSIKGKFDGSFDWVNDTCKVMLVTSLYTPNVDTHVFIDDVTNEVVGTGYIAGGATLLGKAVIVDNTLDLAKYDANDYTWGTSTITAKGAVIYKDTGVPSTSPLICYIDFGTDKISEIGDFAIIWSVNGIFTLQ